MKWKTGESAPLYDDYVCIRCGHLIILKTDEKFPKCPECGNDTWELS